MEEVLVLWLFFLDHKDKSVFQLRVSNLNKFINAWFFSLDMRRVYKK
jgi:hypothetical protein